MTRDKGRKRQIRARMAATGEKYTEAARAIATAHATTPDRATLTAAVLTLMDQSFTAHIAGDRAAADRYMSQAAALDAFAVSGITGGMRIGQIPNPERELGRWKDYLDAARADVRAVDVDAVIATALADPPSVFKDPVDLALEGLTRKDYGPLQFPEVLGMPIWQFERARRDRLIPGPDRPGGRWSARLVAQALADVNTISRRTGSLPDMGAYRASEVLAERFGVEVDAEILLELDRMGLIPVAGDYKGNVLYDGRALEQFPDRDALMLARRRGKLLTRDQVAEYFQVRPADVAHLINAGWLEPVTHVRSGWQRRREAPAVLLFRTGDLEVLREHPAIDWDAVRATPRGRPSQLARLPRPAKN